MNRLILVGIVLIAIGAVVWSQWPAGQKPGPAPAATSTVAGTVVTLKVPNMT